MRSGTPKDPGTAVDAVLAAALELFSHQGYGATSMRQIADRSGVSIGNVYHHLGSKGAIFRRLLDRYWERLLDPDLRLNRVFASARFPDDLEEMAAAIEEVVEANSESILLIFIDVIEFRGEHIRTFYDRMAERFERVYGEELARRRAAGEFGDADPMAAVMFATRWLFYYFTVERCFGVPMHLGRDSTEVVREFAHLLRYGLLARDPPLPGAPAAIDERMTPAHEMPRRNT